MNNYAIKYRPGAGGEFLVCMIEGLDKDIIVEPDENNRYVGAHVESWHQSLGNYFNNSGLTYNNTPRFSNHEVPDKHCMTFHLWNLDYIIQLCKLKTKVLVIEDSTIHSDILAFHKIPTYKGKSAEDHVKVQMPRYKEWSQVYSDNETVMNYAKKLLDIRTVEHDEFYEYSFEQLEEILAWLAGVKLTKEWYEIFKTNTITNKGIINIHKDDFIRNLETENDTN